MTKRKITSIRKPILKQKLYKKVETYHKESRVCKFCGNYTENSSGVCDGCEQDFDGYEYN